MGTRSRKAHLGATVSSLLFVVASLLAVPASAGAADLSISIDKTVYLGHDGGAGCSGVDSLEGASGAAITYCFAVTNTGSEALAGAAVSDPALGISSDDMTLRSGDPALLTPGAGALWFYETSITSDLINTATVGAFPLDPSGGPSYGDGPIIASDSASVTVSEAGGPSEPLPAGISIDKTVYAGHDAGASCPGANAVTVAAGTDLTFCFQVTNTGETYLANVTIDDAILGITQDQMTVSSGSLALMAPGAVTTLYYETTAGELAYTNTAITTGTPSDEEGNPIPETQPPTDEDDASVDIEDESVTPTAAIDIVKLVYEGHDSGAGCGTTADGDTVTAADGTPITYCFVVTNTGEAYLANVTVDDPTLGITDADMTLLSGDPALLAPGATVVWYYETTLDGDLDNVASTTGTPADEAGNPIPDVQPPTDQDDASVDIEDQTVTPTAAIDIVKLVYEGHDSGAGCATTADGDTVSATNGTEITYCFVVTNTGEAYLANVTVDDPDLGITDTDMTVLSGDPALLAPGATVVWYYETILDGDLDNVASTTGTPADEAGTPIPDVQPPTDQDDASVRETDEPVVVLPDDLETDIQIEKTVYEGHTDGAGCATAGEDVFAEYGTLITYCFAVTNTGTVHLANVTVDDPTLGITDSDMTLLSGDPALLAPGDTVVWYYETTLDDDIRNVATTTGTPSNPDGTPIPATPPTDSDDALVGEQAVLQEELPSTGIDADVIAWLGVAMLAAGAVLISTDRLRRGRTASIASSRNVTPGLWTLYSTAPSRERATARRRRLRR